MALSTEEELVNRHEPKSPVQPGPGSHLKGEVGERVVESRHNGKWRRKTTKTLGGDAVQSLWVNTLTRQTLTLTSSEARSN